MDVGIGGPYVADIAAVAIFFVAVRAASLIAAAVIEALFAIPMR